jgi:hypothetical protein
MAGKKLILTITWLILAVVSDSFPIEYTIELRSTSLDTDLWDSSIDGNDLIKRKGGGSGGGHGGSDGGGGDGGDSGGSSSGGSSSGSSSSGESGSSGEDGSGSSGSSSSGSKGGSSGSDSDSPPPKAPTTSNLLSSGRYYGGASSPYYPGLGTITPLGLTATLIATQGLLYHGYWGPENQVYDYQYLTTLNGTAYDIDCYCIQREPCSCDEIQTQAELDSIPANHIQMQNVSNGTNVQINGTLDGPEQSNGGSVLRPSNMLWLPLAIAIGTLF